MKVKSLLLGLGTAAIGRPQYINIRQEIPAEFSVEIFRKKGLAALEDAYRQGIRYFDTAPGYGMAEKLLMDWVAGKEDASIEIATKWGYTYVANFDPKAEVHEIKEHSSTFETGVLRNERILNRLAVLKEEYGLHMGLSTTGANQVEVLKEALDVEVEGVALFDAFQVTYNLFDQSLATMSKEFLKHNKRLIIKEALANGRVFPNKKYPHYASAYKTLQTLADKYSVGLDAIALRFCMDSIDVYKVLSGASNSVHLSDNLKVNQFELEESDIRKLKIKRIRN